MGADHLAAPRSDLHACEEGDPAFPMEFEFLDDRVVVYAFDSPGALLNLYD